MSVDEAYSEYSDEALRKFYLKARYPDHGERDFRDKAFLAAAETYDNYTRCRHRDEARAKMAATGEKGGKIAGDLNEIGRLTLDGLITFRGKPINERLLRICIYGGKSAPAKGLARLRAAGIIEPDSYEIRWQRFGMDKYDSDLAALGEALGQTVSNITPNLAFLYLPYIAAFGSAELTLENLLFMMNKFRADKDDKAEILSEVSALRSVGLVHPDIYAPNVEAMIALAQKHLKPSLRKMIRR